MATVAQIQSELDAAQSILGNLETQLSVINNQTLDVNKQLRAARAAGDKAAADSLAKTYQDLTNQSMFLDDKIRAESAKINALVRALNDAKEAADEAAKAPPTPPATEERTAQQKAESDKTTPVVDKPAPVPPQDTGNVNTAPTSEKPAQTKQTIANDDNLQNNNSGLTSAANSSSNTPQQNTIKQGNLSADGAIEPRPNILDQYSSYTYSASVYLMSRTQYNRLLRSKKKTINGYNLLFQSGGAPGNVGGPLPVGQAAELGVGSDNQTDYGRNPEFPQDFYIDSITIDNTLPGRQTQAAHMVTNLKFTVIEPGNISLLDRIYAAVQNMGQTIGDNATETLNYTAAAYLMVIRWYGYDEKGNIVDAKTDVDPDNTMSDPRAICEKFIPFLIKKINWSVGSKLVTYEFDCAPIGQMVAGGTRRGTIPYDVQLTSATVGELLGGNAVYSSRNAPANSPGDSTTSGTGYNGSAGGSGMQGNSERMTEQTPVQPSAMYAAAAPAKANAATDRKIIKLGLVGAMNEFQQQLVLENIYQKADSYEIVFVAGRDGKQNIRDAVLQIPPGFQKEPKPGEKKPAEPTVESSNTGMGTAARTNANQALNPETNAVNISSRNYSITAGMQVIQAIDLAIRNSSYITSQALVINHEDGTQSQNTDRTEPMRWFKINMEAEQGDYDRYRNDNAYKIRFVISEYEVPDFNSVYFPVSKFRGVHKSYPYWFTGQNTAVLDYTATFNTLYNITVTGTTPQNSGAAQQRRKFTSSMRDIPKYTFASASTESRSGAFAKGNEIAANASEYLYSPGDLALAKIRIIGDPAWIQQGSISGGVSVQDFSYSPFLSDGSINFDASQVMFEIAWQRPQDYDIATGLADPYRGAQLEARQPLQSNVYIAYKVVSEFKQGRFEQNIEGTLFSFPIPSGKNTVAAAATPDQSDAETARLTQQNAAAQQAIDTRPQSTDPANPGQRLAVVNNANGAATPSARQTDALRNASRKATAIRPFIPGNNTAVNQAAATAAVATGASTLLPGKPPVSNGQVVGPAFNRVLSTTPGRLNINLADQAIFRNNPQKGARDN